MRNLIDIVKTLLENQQPQMSNIQQKVSQLYELSGQEWEPVSDDQIEKYVSGAVKFAGKILVKKSSIYNYNPTNDDYTILRLICDLDNDYYTNLIKTNKIIAKMSNTEGH